MDTNGARGFTNGVAIRMLRSPSPGFNKLPRITRVAKSFHSGGKTCNVIKNGMPKLTLYGLHLDNTECVRDIVTPAGLPNALKNFGPDQMEVVRFTKLWHDYNPTAGRLDYIHLQTWHDYRAQYPGRSLVACDALNSKKYPPDPIQLSEAGILEVQTLNNDKVISEKSLAEAFVFNNIVDVFGPDTADNLPNEILCSPPVESDDPSEICGTGCILSPVSNHCINMEGAQLYSAPIDIVLWDFQGVVLFGPTWTAASSDDPAVTVLVYGNPMSTATTHTADVGSIFLDIPPNKITRTMPTSGLNLLDCSDFYDVVSLAGRARLVCCPL